jgi:hypothetical protein
MTRVGKADGGGRGNLAGGKENATLARTLPPVHVASMEKRKKSGRISATELVLALVLLALAAGVFVVGLELRRRIQ